MTRIRLILLSVCVLLPVLPARADDLSCLPKAKGQLVKWDKDWQADLTDHDVTYVVESVTPREVRNEPSGFVLLLTAKGEARKHQRTATIIKELAARFFCGRIITTASDGGLRVGNPPPMRRVSDIPEAKEVQDIYPGEDPSPSKLSFRRWMKNTWVPAVPAPNEELFVCRIPGGPIACNGADYALLNRDPGLSALPKSTVWLKLPGPFIRHSAEGGWTRDEPLGPYADASIVECPVLGKTFYCLADEKTKYKSELQDLEREIALQRSLNAPKAVEKKSKK